MDVKQAECCADELSTLQIETIESIIKIADKYNIERDRLINKFGNRFALMAGLSTFKDYKIKQEEK